MGVFLLSVIEKSRNGRQILIRVLGMNSVCSLFVLGPTKCRTAGCNFETPDL